MSQSKKHTHKHNRNFVINLAIIGVGVFIGVLLSRIDVFQTTLLNLGNLRYVAVFIGGMLFVSTFTVATGSLILFHIAQTMPPIETAVLAACGAVVSNLTIFHFVQDDIVDDLVCLYDHFGGNHLHHLLYSRYFHWFLPVIGSLIMISPFPDELAVSLLGLSKMNTLKFVILSFSLHVVGIFLFVALTARIRL